MTAPPDQLQSIQHWMQHALIAPDQTDPASTKQLIDQPPSGTAASRLAIYQRSYYDRLQTCMREQFPALCHALGRELFDDFALEYIQAKPPVSYTLYDLGRRFADHLANSRPDRDADDGDKQNWIDFMIELAQFERQIFVLFDAPGHEGSAFATRETTDDRLMLQPCFAVCGYAFPVARYYHDVKGQADPGFPPAQPSYYALVRTNFITRTLAITAPQHHFLQLVQNGQQISDALAASAQAYGLDPDEVRDQWSAPQGLKAMWTELGFFVENADLAP